jgi:hypothetical protein
MQAGQPELLSWADAPWVSHRLCAKALKSPSGPPAGCGLYAPSRLSGLASRSPRCFGGRVARRRLGAWRNKEHGALSIVSA